MDGAGSGGSADEKDHSSSSVTPLGASVVADVRLADAVEWNFGEAKAANGSTDVNFGGANADDWLLACSVPEFDDVAIAGGENSEEKASDGVAVVAGTVPTDVVDGSGEADGDGVPRTPRALLYCETEDNSAGPGMLLFAPKPSAMPPGVDWP